MNEQNDPRTCLECGKWVGEERERLQVQACMECMPPIAPPPRTTDGARLVAELTGGVDAHAERPLGREFAPGCFEREPVDLRVGPREPDEHARDRLAAVEPLGRWDGTYPDAPADCAACGEPSHVGEACPPEGGKAPPIVTLCGSTRFRRAFEEATYRLTLEGWAVLSLACFGREETRGRDGLTPRQKEELDALHLKKVAMSKRVHVLNVGGYIGESTTREIAHAFALKIAITFAEEKAGNAWLEEHAHELGELIAGRLSSAGGGLVAPSPRPKKPHPFGRRFSK